MDQFNVNAKLWPSGASFDDTIDTNLVTVPSSFTRHAKDFESSSDGSQQFQFLFWNTGRHVTNKRHVRWNFSVGGWGLWTATKWYGVPPVGNGGAKRVRVDPFTIGGDAAITGSGTAIDSAASTFASGAFPFNGDDHEIGTANGAVDAVAKEPFALLHFAGWVQLIWGGDDSGEFIETDTGSAPGTPGFFPSGSGPFHVNKNGAADLLALYGDSARRRFTVNLAELLAELSAVLPPSPVDPSPEDRIRLAILEEILRKSQPGQQVATEFQQIIEAAPRMNAAELRSAVKSLQATVNLGQTAISTVQALIKKAKK
jgi:hypothetical protein